MRAKILIILFLMPFVAFGQKELTLSDAVMKQYRDFYPEHIAGFLWIPGTNDYSYLDGYVKLVKGSVGKEGTSSLLTITELNERAGVEFGYFSNMNWLTK